MISICFGAVLADGDFLLSAGVDAAGHRGDQLVHVDRLARYLLRLIDFVDQDYAAAEVDAQFEGRPHQQDHRARQQAEQADADLPAVIGHAELLAQVAAQEKRHGQRGHGHQQVDDTRDRARSGAAAWANNGFTYQGMIVSFLIGWVGEAMTHRNSLACLIDGGSSLPRPIQ